MSVHWGRCILYYYYLFKNRGKSKLVSLVMIKTSIRSVDVSSTHDVELSSGLTSLCSLDLDATSLLAIGNFNRVDFYNMKPISAYEGPIPYMGSMNVSDDVSYTVHLFSLSSLLSSLFSLLFCFYITSLPSLYPLFSLYKLTLSSLYIAT